MKVGVAVIACVCVALTLSWAGEKPSDYGKYWPQWRGPTGNGVALGNDPPVEWSETKNIRWKIDIPGKGSSSPIIWGDRLLVTTAIPVGDENGDHAPQENGRQNGQQGRRRGPRGIQPDQVQQFVVYAINRQDGNILWQKTLREEKPHQGTHMTGTWASNSAVTDGKHIYAYFGSRGLYCLDMDGNLIWERDFGDMDKKMSFGEGSSPVLHEDKIFILWDHNGPSYLFAVDKMTGKDVWKVGRDEITTWTTPLVVEHGGTHQLIASGTNKVRSYDASSGELIWETSGMTANVIPMPVYVDGLVLVTSGFRGNALLAIDLDKAKGDITDSDAIVWRLDKDTPYAPSPLLYDDTLYFLKTNTAILSSFNAKTGAENYRQQRLEDMGTVYSSPVGAAGRVYITDRDGNTTVIRHGPTFEVLAKNSLDDGFDASMAVVDDQIYMRGHSHLYCIAEDR
jgi:outer membrane protein assembly factor BamB